VPQLPTRHHVGVISKIDSAWVARVRAATCMANGVILRNFVEVGVSSTAGPVTP